MSTTTSSSTPAVRAVRTALAVSGAVSLIVGLWIFFLPRSAILVAAGVAAAYVIVAGLVNIGIGIFFRSGWARIGYIVLGVLFILAGIFAFANLASTAIWLGVFFGTLIGILWIIEGVVSLTTLSHGSSRGWTIFFAIVSIVAGVVLLFSPLLGAVTLFLLVGISLIVLGIFQIVRAIRFHKTF